MHTKPDIVQAETLLTLDFKDVKTVEKKVKQTLKRLFKYNDNSQSQKVSHEQSAVEEKDENEIESNIVLDQLDEAKTLSNLENLIDCIQRVGSKQESIHFVTLTLDLFCGHSRIRELLLQRPKGLSRIRAKLIELFCVLCTVQLSICKDRLNLVDLLLGAYDATFSFEDQSLLRLLSLLEINGGISLQRYQPFMWGVNGALFYASKHSQKLAFLKLPSIDEVFRTFDGKQLTNSLVTFPIHVPLPEGRVPIISSELYGVNAYVYDPRFMLPTLYHFLSDGSMVKCHKFISYGALSYTIAALSSECTRIRSVAYRILSLLHHRLNCINYPKDRQLWIGLLEYLRSGITEPNQRLESVHTVFFVRTIESLLRPLGPMFSSIRQYLLAAQLKPYNYRALSGYYKVVMHLITTTNQSTYTVFQKFAIEWITDSLRTAADVRLCHRKNVFRDMLTLYNSPLCSSDNRPFIMRLLIRLASLYEGVKVLCFDCAIFAWIKHQLIIAPSMDIAEVTNKAALYKLVITIWDAVFAYHTTILADKTQKIENEQNGFIFYPTFGYELVDVLSRILYKTTDKCGVEKLLQICTEIMNHHDDPTVRLAIRYNICSNLPVNLDKFFNDLDV